MSFEYSAENHDWDLTLTASRNLLMFGQAVIGMSENKRKKEQELSLLTGSMLLAFCSIESFITSIAFSMSHNEKYKDFNYAEYKELQRFWDKLEKVCSTLGFQIDKSQGMFQMIRNMQLWRNALCHASPYEIEKKIIIDTPNEPHRIHKPFYNKEYVKLVTLIQPKIFILPLWIS